MTDFALDGAEGAIEIDGYEIEAVIGSGGMGTVYRARQLSLGQPVAIKVLAEAFRRQPNFVQRFRQEAHHQAALQHPNVVPVYANGESGGTPYIVMRLISGPSLRQLLREGPQDTEYVIDLLDGIAAALDFAHGQGVLHLDVKPHNILIEGGHHTWLADFGLTRLLEESTGLTLSNGLVGSFDYLAPEIAFGESASPSSDVYSFGVTTFQALTGSLPFPAAHQAAAIFAHASADRPEASKLRPALPRGVDAVLKRCLAIDPRERPASATAFLDELRKAAGMPVRTRRAEPNPVAVWPKADTSNDGQPLVDAPSWARTRALPRPAFWRRRKRALGGGLAVMATGAAALVLLVGNGTPAYSIPANAVRETLGGESHTWTNYQYADGQNGPLIPAHSTIFIACRLRGYKVQDGNTWWYRIASKPWDGNYYTSADGFYNNGHTRGTLKGTPFVDPKVVKC